VTPLRRAPLLAAALLTMAWSVWLGLARLGWPVPVPSGAHTLLHGPLLISGFFGTLITLERAVALGAWPAYAGPVLSVAGSALLLAGLTGPGALAATGASAVLVVASLLIYARERSLYALVMWGGAAAWLAGNIQWLAGGAVHQVVYWWTGFLVLTIAGERLELNRMLRPAGGVRAWFVASILLLGAGLVTTSFELDAGVRVTGAGMMLLAAWLLRHDLARRTVHMQGVTRFMAVCLLTGYVWLGAGGLMAAWFGYLPAGPRYDALLHAVLLGFVMAMVFAHAPVIFPAILGVRLPYHPSFYGHLALLHGSLVLRVVGDLVAGAHALRGWGGLLNAVALLLFVGNTAWSIVRVEMRTPSTGGAREGG
jgi:hypothetical protein